jgi:hypothetical protein
MDTNKICPKCNQEKKYMYFHKSKNRKDGHCVYCKECVKLFQKTQKYKDYQKEYQKRYGKTAKGRMLKLRQAKKYQAANPNKVEQYRKSEKGKQVHRRAQTKYYKSNPLVCEAHLAVRKAIKKGLLHPASYYKCFCCPNQASQYHHHNGYSKEHKNDVMPVCHSCHTGIHKKD